MANLLIVDDDTSILKLLEQCLEAAGHCPRHCFHDRRHR